LFNSDPEVVAIVASIMPYIALFQVRTALTALRRFGPIARAVIGTDNHLQIADGVAATAGSILRSLGLHTTGALINLTSYYIIGLPFGLWLTFQPKLDLGLIGLWIGLSVALGYASVVSFVLVWRANWVRAVERVRERLGLAAHGEVGEDGKWLDDEEAERGRRASRDV
jgi:MATE family multidrug resistance protein